LSDVRLYFRDASIAYLRQFTVFPW